MTSFLRAPLACCVTWLAAAAPLPADTSLARQVETVLTTHCGRCHGPEGTAKGGMNYILDRTRLVTRQKLVPGNPADSKLWQRMHKGDMPPASVKNQPTADELASVRQWIELGAPSFAPVSGPRSFLPEADVVYLLGKDLQALAPFDRQFVRYLTLTTLFNAGVADADLQTARLALAKLLNSLSWHQRITVPKPIDVAQTIYRIDLRDYLWRDERIVFDAWESLVTAYPYRLPQDAREAKAWKELCGTELPYLRADWFVATASRPPLYQAILQMPLTDRDLERLLRVDAERDLKQRQAVRSGFNGSGIARNNRLLERHDAAHGAYWHSYDFSDNVDRQNLFERPLGPQPGENRFQHAGGEIIFHLPNGLQAYMLVDANGRRIDRAPIEIVSDPKRPDKVVETGVSCMSCHVQGVMHKADQIRAHVEKNPLAFPKEDVEIIRALYLPEAQFKKRVDEDAERFKIAVAKTGGRVEEADSISTLTLRYEVELDLPLAAAEAGLPPDEFLQRLSHAKALPRILGPLNVKGGTVQRQVVQTSFPDMVRELGLGDSSRPYVESPRTEEARPFAGHTGQILSLAFSPDGRRALSGSEDTSVRLWDLTNGHEVRPLEGHTGEVLAVAFAPDGKRALSGGYDRTVRLWDLASGREIQRMEGHTERVSGVAFAPDGRRALSSSWDQTISLWDLETGREIRRLGGHASYISSVAFSPDGRHALSGGYDKTVRLWDLATGREARAFEEHHTKEVYSVAFSWNGRFALSGGNDQRVYLWDVASGRVVRRFEGAARAIVRVAFSGDGRRILAGSSQYQAGDQTIRVWDVDSGRELRGWGGKEGTVWSLAFSADGTRALLAGQDKTLRLVDLAK